MHYGTNSKVRNVKRGQGEERRGEKVGEVNGPGQDGVGDEGSSSGREDNVEGRGEGESGGGEGGTVMGREKRVRKGTNPFQFSGEHLLYSQSSAKYKKKTVAVIKSKEKRARFYKKKHFGDLKNQVKALKTVVQKQASKLAAQSRKIKTMKAK